MTTTADEQPAGETEQMALAEALRDAGVEVGSVGGAHLREVVATRLLRRGYRLSGAGEQGEVASVAAALGELADKFWSAGDKRTSGELHDMRRRVSALATPTQVGEPS